MLLALLLLAHAAADWVEISQQHYRKPIRTHSSFNPFTTPDKFELEETTKAWRYDNKSVTEYNWNKAGVRQPNTGSVRRMQIGSSTVKSTELISIEDGYSDLDKDEFELRTQEPTRPTTQFSETTKQKATITRIPNKNGNVKRVQLSSTPVKSPFLNKDDRENINKSRYEELPLENERDDELIKHKRRTESKINTRRIYVNEIKNRYNTEPTNIFPSEDETSVSEEVIIKHPKQELKNSASKKNIISPKPTFITESDDFTRTESEENVEKIYKVKQNTPRVTDIKDIFTTESTIVNENVNKNTEARRKQPIKESYKTGESDKHRPVNGFQQAEHDDDEKITSNEQRKPTKKNGNVEREQTRIPEKENTINKKAIPDKEKKDTMKGNQPDSKVKNMENLLKLMKVVADTISQNTRRSFGGKMRYLHDLKDTILANIAERIDATWPDDDITGAHRRSRSAHGSARGHHVHFPSSESALMTISFLTFAVFLIKLVLQVIHTYKNKAMMVAPVMVATAGRGALAHRGTLT